MSHVHTLEHTNSNEERSFLIAKVGGGGGKGVRSEDFVYTSNFPLWVQYAKRLKDNIRKIESSVRFCF